MFIDFDFNALTSYIHIRSAVIVIEINISQKTGFFPPLVSQLCEAARCVFCNFEAVGINKSGLPETKSIGGVARFNAVGQPFTQKRVPLRLFVFLMHFFIRVSVTWLDFTHGLVRKHFCHFGIMV